MKTIDLLSDEMKTQLKDAVLNFWDRRIERVTIKFEGKDGYNGLEIYANWLIQTFQEILDQDINLNTKK